MEKRFLGRILSQIQGGTLKVTYWDGETREYGAGELSVHVIIHKRSALRKMLKSPSLAIGEAYMNGDVEFAGQIENLLELAHRNHWLLGSKFSRKFNGLHKNKKSHQAKYVSHHYDIGNDFYKLWLDASMTYSCAYFHKKSDSLEQAQRQKIDHILKKLQLNPGMELLDIGSGWGHLLVDAAKKYKVRCTGVSLSREQIKFARQLAKREGVDKLVTFKLQNYLDLPAKQAFDRVVSVGFFEHVGYGNHRDYFAQIQKLLKPDGISVLHSITHQKESPTEPWIDKYIFPGGYIPSVRETTALLPKYNLYLFDYENLGQHYAMTLERWWHSFEQHKDEVINMYDERFYRMWRLYLAGSMSTFKTGSAQLSQWTFKKGSDPSWPLTRGYLYKP